MKYSILVHPNAKHTNRIAQTIIIYFKFSAKRTDHYWQSAQTISFTALLAKYSQNTLSDAIPEISDKNDNHKVAIYD